MFRPKLLLNDKVYKIVNLMVMFGNPGFASLYFAWSFLYDLPDPTMVIGLIALLTLPLAFVLKMNQSRGGWKKLEYDGYIELETDPGGVKMATMNIEGDPETLLMSKDEITFRIKR